MYYYATYGLRLRSEIPLPELVEGEAESVAMVNVRLGRVALDDPDAQASRTDLTVSTDGTRFSLKDVATYWARDGREIVIDPHPGAEAGLIRLNLLGLAMGLLLHQRGLLVLHASVVNVGGGAVAFLGFSGDGKSTTAAALLERGHGVVSDDAAAIQITPLSPIMRSSNDAQPPMVFPAFPELRLLPESAHSLGLPPSALITRFHTTDKQSRRYARNFSQDPLPMRRIYVLEYGAHNKIQPLRQAAACAQFMRHSHVAGILQSTGTAASHFQNCTRLAESVPVALLMRHRSLEELNSVAAMIEDDLAQIA
jgi:hypothetical protein